MMRKRSNDKKPLLRSRHGTSENEGGESASLTRKEKTQNGVSPRRSSRARTLSLKKCNHSGAEPLLVSSDTDASCDFHTPLDANGTDESGDFPVLSTRNLDDWKTNGNWVDFEQTPIATIPESPKKSKSKSSEDEEIRSPVKKKKKLSDPMSPKKKSKEKKDKKKSAASSKTLGDDVDAKAVAKSPKKATAKEAVSIPKSPSKKSQNESKPESLSSPTKKKKPKDVTDTPKTPKQKKTSKSKKTAESCGSKTAALESPKKSSTKKSPKPTTSTAKKSTASAQSNSKPTFSFCDTDDSSASSSASETAPITPKKKVNDEKLLKSPAKKSTKSKTVADKPKRASSPSKKPKAVVKTRPEADSDEAADSLKTKLAVESSTTREISSPGKKKKEKVSKTMTTNSSNSEEKNQTEKAKKSHTKVQEEDAADGHVLTTGAKEKDDEDSSSSCSSGNDEGGESLTEAVWLNLTLNDAGTTDPPLPSSQTTSTESSSPSAPASPVKRLSLDDSDSSSDSDFEPTTPGGRPQGLSSYNEQKAAVAKRSPVPKTAESNSLANLSPGKDRMKFLKSDNNTETTSSPQKASPTSQAMAITMTNRTESSIPPEPAPSSPVKRLSLDDSDSSTDSSGGQQGYMVSYAEQRAAVAKRRPAPKKAASKSLANVSSLKDRTKFLQSKASSNTVPAQSPGKKAPSPEKDRKGVIASPQIQDIPYLDCSSHSRESENKTEVPAKHLSLDDSDSDSDSESPLIVCGRTLGISSLSPVPTSPVKRLSLDDSDSSSDPDFVPPTVGGRPQAFLASYDEQRTAISKRRPVVERAASKSLENVSSLKDRMKFLQANESAKESKNPVSTTPRKAGLLDIKKPEVPRRAATKSLENVVSLKDRMNGHNFLSSGAQVCEPNEAMANHEEDVSSSAKEGGNAVINRIPQLQHPRASDGEGTDSTTKKGLPCRRSSASAISPLRGGAGNSRFEELKRLAMKAAHEIASDDEGDGSTNAVKQTIPSRRSSTSAVSPLKNGEGNSRFQGPKWQATKAAQDVALDDNKNGSGAVAQVAVPRRSSTSAVSPLRKGEGNSRFQELKRLAMKAAHEVASDDDEDNSNAVKQAVPPRRSSTSAVPSKGRFWLRNPIATTGGNTSGNESIQSPQISVMKLPKIQEHALDEGGNNTLPQQSSTSAASPMKGREVNTRFQELKRLAMKAAHEIASDDEGDGSTNAVKQTIPSRRSSTSAVSPLRGGAGNSRFQGLKWQAMKAAQEIALDGDEDSTNAMKQTIPSRRSSTSAVLPVNGGAGNSRFQGPKWQATKAAQDVALDDNKNGSGAVAQVAVPRRSSTSAVSPLRKGEGNSRFQELKRLAMKAAHEVASDDDEDNSNAVKQAVPPRRSSTSAVPPSKGKFWLKNPSATTGGNPSSNNGIQPPPPPTVAKPSKFQELRQQAMRLTNEALSSNGSPKSSKPKFQKLPSFESTNVPKMKLWKLDDNPSRQVEALVSPRRKIKSKPSQQHDSDGSSLEELRKKDAELRRALAETLADDDDEDDYDSDDDDDDASESSSDSDDSLEKLRKREAELLLEIEDTLHGSSDDDDDDDENDSDSDSDSDQDGGDRRIVEVAAVVPPPSPTKRLSLDDSSSSSDGDGFPQNFCAGGTNFAEQQRQARRRAPPPDRHPSQSLANVTSLKDRKNMFSSK